MSEVMLQQTQVERVVPFYKKFIQRFPTPRRLSASGLPEVLRLWSGLGYNRRALALKRAAEIMVSEHGGRVPHETEKLRALPGVGPYTAGAVRAFTWNEPAVLIETNIRTAFLHHFFPKWKRVGDGEIAKLVEKTLPKSSPKAPSFIKGGGRGVDLIRHWYYALMDYGAHLKQTLGNQNARSAHYAKQARFAGSVRQIRGEILRRALVRPIRRGEFPRDIISGLVAEGFLQKRVSSFILA